MKETDKNEPNPGMSPVRNSLKDRALTPDENRVKSLEDPLETGDGKKNSNVIDDEEQSEPVRIHTAGSDYIFQILFSI